MNYDDFPDIMSVDEVKNVLRIGRNKAYELIRIGAIDSIRIGRSIRVPKVAVMDFIRSTCYNNSTATGELRSSLEVLR